MPVHSFSASKLAALIAKLSEPTVGLDTIRYDILPIARDIIDQNDAPAKRVLAYVLWTRCMRICDYFDGEPMSIEQSQELIAYLKGPLTKAVTSLSSDRLSTDEAISLADSITRIALE